MIPLKVIAHHAQGPSTPLEALKDVKYVWGPHAQIQAIQDVNLVPQVQQEFQLFGFHLSLLDAYHVKLENTMINMEDTSVERVWRGNTRSAEPVHAHFARLESINGVS